MSREIYDPASDSASIFADTVFVEEGRPTSVLGPDGEPLRFVHRRRVGFDLRQAKEGRRAHPKAKKQER